MFATTWFGFLATANYCTGNVWVGAICNVCQVIALARHLYRAK